MILTSNKSVTEWPEVFGDHAIATAILDRLLHHSHVLSIKGNSYRLWETRHRGDPQPRTDPYPSRRENRERPRTTPPKGWSTFQCSKWSNFSMFVDSVDARRLAPRDRIPGSCPTS